MTSNTTLSQQAENYQRIESAIHYLEEHFQDQPNLDEIAASVHLSKYHFQRLFKEWAGITPAQFLGYLTIEYAKTQLERSRSVLEASLEAGLSSPSRLHDLFITFEAMTPGEYKQGGAGITITYGFHPTPFGTALFATTDRGVCALRFAAENNRGDLLQELQMEWPQAQFVENPAVTGTIVERLFGDTPEGAKKKVHLLLRGTNFQVQVWQALLKIPPGDMVTYSDVAELIGKPAAVRAAASAIAKNPVGYLIPCHRVINKAGKAHNYRWGGVRKKAILGWEAAQM